ncbi:MAG TPA: hypothetical protein VI876_04795 [Dehalococcoidia bacterium]|nr:hypothetical protein [Dehalococcoidia bacterium]
MNLTVSSSTWKHARTRYIVGISGVALALSVAIGGISPLPGSGGREASVTPETLSQPITLPTAADFATIGSAYIQPQTQAVVPQFATSADAYFASMVLAVETVNLTGPAATPQQEIPQQFPTMMDAFEASIAAMP